MSKIKVENGYNLFSPRYKSSFTYKDKDFFNVYQFMLYSCLPQSARGYR